MRKNMPNYGPISSEGYGIWFPEDKKYEDADFFMSLIKEGNGPALELGCGDGRLLLSFVEQGLDVDGLDLSPHMLQMCRQRAEKRGLTVSLYEQAMQDLSIPRKYKTLFVPYGSFMLISTLPEVNQALARFYAHLLPEGRLAVSLFIPPEADIHQAAPKEGEWRLRREGTRSDGATIRCFERAQFDRKKQTEWANYKYEVVKEGKVIATETEDLTLRWHTQQQFHTLLKDAGFKEVMCVCDYSSENASPADSEFTFIAKK